MQNSKSPKAKPGSSFNDTLKINPPAAVFYSPDSLQLVKIKAILEKQDFESIIHDCFYQMRNSRQVLEKYYPAVKITEVKNARYLIFNERNGRKELIDLDQKDDPCGIFIFDGIQSPRPVDMMNIETELGFYFQNGD